jgi:hypothetical protein
LAHCAKNSVEIPQTKRRAPALELLSNPPEHEVAPLFAGSKQQRVERNPWGARLRRPVRLMRDPRSKQVFG